MSTGYLNGFALVAVGSALAVDSSGVVHGLGAVLLVIAGMALMLFGAPGGAR